MVSRYRKVANFANFLFLLLLITIRFGLLAEIRWSVCTSKSHRSLCVSFSRTGAGVVHIPFIRMIKLKFLAHLLVEHIIIIIIKFLALLSISLNPLPGFYPRPCLWEGSDYVYSIHSDFFIQILQIYSCFVFGTFLRTWSGSAKCFFFS